MSLADSTIDVLQHNRLRAWCYYHWPSSLGNQYFGRSPVPRESRCICLSLVFEHTFSMALACEAASIQVDSLTMLMNAFRMLVIISND